MRARRGSRRGAQWRKPAREAAGDAAQRVESRARRLGWLRRGALAAAVMAGLAGAAWGTAWLLAPGTFPLQSVYFDSRLQHVREDDLRDALRGHLDDGFLGLDVDAIHAALEALPWVRSAAVRRVWPGQLRVEIREQVAAAVWNGEALLNTSGEAFDAPEDTWPSDLPELSGPAGREVDVVQRHQEVERTLGRIGLAVDGLAMDARESWTIELETGARIRLGRESVDRRLARFLAAYPGLVRERGTDLAHADLRYPNGFSVRWREDGNHAAD
ncbi:cell division protein FtsQ/DivIB [Aquisalimonas sp.]|uniref:cell division protein FtsQ/DivIB n=1 Tax=Aquisalimonas sp. TaxID=1872621 RepID=UPI0025C57356|nr:cell division protein FtsQ/DivIB [Aquisalimonas sp.]